MSARRYCSDCTHYVAAMRRPVGEWPNVTMAYDSARCGSSKIAAMLGQNLPIYALDQRRIGGICGPYGVMFEPKITVKSE